MSNGPPPKLPNAGAPVANIFQIEVHLPNAVVVPKVILFQAKKYEGSSRSDLIYQVEKMESTAPNGSAVFEFGPDGHKGALGRDILETRKLSPTKIPHPGHGLGSYLADRFMPCEAGLRGMYYDAVRRNLIVPMK
jgi:hypothetical protein